MRLDVSYDGTDFAGWARQPGQRTVQGVLEEALATVFRRVDDPPTITVAGRTDAGVHATGQVAHVDLTHRQCDRLARPHGGRPAPDPAVALARRLNGIAGLASDVVVRSATFAPEGFDARFSPLWRSYVYRIADARAERNPLHRRFTVWHPAELDERAMSAAANELLGLHDWAAYCRPREGATTIRELQEFAWHREADGVLVARLRADAFCHSMVRALVGATVTVGMGELTGSRLVELREDRARTSAFRVMPAAGLTLVEVGYPPDSELGLRAAQTRARRDDPFDPGSALA